MRRGEGLLNGGAAFYQIYRTADDRFVTLSPLEPKFWDNFCTAVGQTEWIAAALRAAAADGADRRGVGACSRSSPLAHWDALLRGADCCYQGVLRLDEVPEHPQIQARGMIDRQERITDVLFPAHVDGLPPEPRAPVQEVAVEAVMARWQPR